MAWRVEITGKALNALEKLNREDGERIVRFLRERVLARKDPRQAGEALKGKLAEFWKYRVGDYRIICRIDDAVFLVLVVQIGHRKEIYRRIR